jgi:hypothetical protein
MEWVENVPSEDATYPIPIVYVPLLMIAHIAAFSLLVRAPGRQAFEVLE